MFNQAIELLEQPSGEADSYPRRIEELELAAFDVTEQIEELSDLAARREEAATAEASSEPNETRRKVRRAEILRDDAEYNSLRSEIRAATRLRLQLTERGHRLAREFRAHLLNREINHLGRRS